jgi:hypothetical protein
MSRAFMKDPEPGDPRCPGCGGLGEPVGSATLDAHVSGAPRTALGGSAFYCAAPSCPTAYFNAWGAVVSADQLARAAWPKDPEAPICSCFGIKAADVISDAREGRKDRIKELVERSKGPDARCTTSAPGGACCVPNVLRLFRETFDARGG